MPSHRKTLHGVKAHTCGSIALYILKRRPMLQYVFSKAKPLRRLHTLHQNIIDIQAIK